MPYWHVYEAYIAITSCIYLVQVERLAVNHRQTIQTGNWCSQDFPRAGRPTINIINLGPRSFRCSKISTKVSMNICLYFSLLQGFRDVPIRTSRSVGADRLFAVQIWEVRLLKRTVDGRDVGHRRVRNSSFTRCGCSFVCSG